MSQHPFQSFMVRYRAGERIFTEGEGASTMFIVHTGKVGLFREAHDSNDSMGVMEKGDFFGEMAILSGLPRTNSAEALDDAELIEINSMIFDKMIRANIEIAIRMLRKLSIRLRETERRLSEFHAAGVRATPQSTPGHTATPLPDADAASGARLEAEEREIVYPLADGETIIGRYDPVTELKPDVDLTDLDLRRSVSRQHARIRESNTGFVVVVEVGALHGTSVNGTPIEPGEPHPIVDGDQLSVGDVSMVFRT